MFPSEINLTPLPAEEEKFRYTLQVMHLLPMLSSYIMIFDSAYCSRAWCMMEWMCATKISPRPTEGGPVPLLNFIKFRHMALLVLYLIKDQDFKHDFARGDDEAVIKHLNALTSRTLTNCHSTIGADKPLLIALMYEHYWNHLRFLGFRTQLMIAFGILDRLEPEGQHSLFAQFLVITEDPDLKWTTEAAFVLESLINGIGNPTDLVFHRAAISTKSNSESK